MVCPCWRDGTCVQLLRCTFSWHQRTMAVLQKGLHSVSMLLDTSVQEVWALQRVACQVTPSSARDIAESKFAPTGAPCSTTECSWVGIQKNETSKTPARAANSKSLTLAATPPATKRQIYILSASVPPTSIWPTWPNPAVLLKFPQQCSTVDFPGCGQRHRLH